MTAHEFGHCWRYVLGACHALPAGFVEPAHAAQDNAALDDVAQSLRETRREEGYADLVALAWTKRRHPGQYGQVLGWLEQVRQPRAEEGQAGSHDTRAWLQLAPAGTAFGPAGNVFEQAATLWREGLQGAD